MSAAENPLEGKNSKQVLLETVALTKSFGSLCVTQDVSIRLEKGARHALLGPNGAGKTTLVSLLSGAIAADSGAISLMGDDITRAKPSNRVHKGLVRTFQISSLFPDLTALENVVLAVSQRERSSYHMFRPVVTRADLRERAVQAIEHMGLIADMHRQVASLAYGRQRLLEMAIALSLRPRVLLLDEPAAGVPGSEVGIILNAMATLPADIAILMVEHDMEVIRRFATDVTVMAAGKVVMSGSLASVLASEDVRALYLGRSGHARLSTPAGTRAS